MELNYSGSGLVSYNQKEYQCDLYVNNDQGGILIKIGVNEPFASFLEFPLSIKFLSGELSNGYKFSLANCSRNKTENLVSEGRSVFSYYAQHMFEGISDKDYDYFKFSKVFFELSDIIEWGNISGYNIGSNYGIFQNNNRKKLIYKNNDFNIKYVVERSILPVALDDLLKENIILNQIGNIEITFKKEKPIEKFDEILKRIKRLIELSTLRNIYLNKVTGFSKKNYNICGQKKIKIPIEIINSNLNKKNTTNNMVQKWKWITLPELIENNSFENYFSKYELLEPVVELYLEIIESNKMSVIRAFLNVVQALETYHSRFKASNIKDFKNRINTVILKDRPNNFIENDKKFLMANSNDFITLESRIADLLIADFNINFDTGDISHLEFPKVISKTRNYYIHYDKGIKESERVLTTEELSIYNRTMLYILEYYILFELGFSNTDYIREKLNVRWGKVSDTLILIKESNKKQL